MRATCARLTGMTMRVGRRASGDQASWVAAAVALLAVGACTGTEHTIFSAIPPPPVVTPPPDRVADAAPPPQPDGGAPEPPDAGDEDAGDLRNPDLDPNVTFTWT